ncbi:AAA family ATPase [Curtobacterium sp. RHCJP20]|uniref:AAA family ATPase n=1 Tax=Curtobacterium subtropicum TaxID=3055138 RepID=A0ABT7TH93_9MICO|nr:AAA family ATPase [Curtobacterium subtropicum]MDM7888739.1 AAA family ATPase [Curtobacterium subtropicum]
MHEYPALRLSGWTEIPSEAWGPDWRDNFTPLQSQSVEEALFRGPLRLGDELVPKNREDEWRERVTGSKKALPIFDPTQEPPTRPYIAGLLNHGRIPALSGPKGVGKTTFVCQLCAALIIRSREFLGVFEPAEVTAEERGRDVWLINSETHPSAVHEELLRAGLAFGYRDGVPCYHDPAVVEWEQQGVLIVEHLPRNGGAVSFDLTDKAKRRLWEERLISFAARRQPPLTVIADGVTAMLGSNTSGYGVWTSGFRRLLQEAGIPNGLGVLHSPMSAVGAGRAPTPMNGVESMGEWDGIWYFGASSFPVFASTGREFYTAPRMGDPVVLNHRMTMGDDGMMRLVPRETKAADRTTSSGASGNPTATSDENQAMDQDVLARLAEAGRTGLTGTEVTGYGREGALRREARDRLVEAGLIFSITEGRGSRWFLSDHR